MCHSTWRNQNGIELEDSSLLYGFHSSKRCCACFQTRKVIKFHTPLRTLPTKTMTNWPDMPIGAIVAEMFWD